MKINDKIKIVYKDDKDTKVVFGKYKDQSNKFYHLIADKTNREMIISKDAIVQIVCLEGGQNE